MMEYIFHKLGDLKNRARRVSRDEELPMHLALEETAQRGGFQSYAHARRQLPKLIEAPHHSVKIVQPWWERESPRCGTANVILELRKKLTELVKPHQLVDYLGGCRIEDEAKLIGRSSMRDRQGSQSDVGRMARSLQFMDVTGLKPSLAQKCYPKGDWDNRPPIADHDSCWFDPEARVHLLMTEPYPGREPRRRQDQAAWELRHGWSTIKAKWGSIYGFGTELYLICPAGYAQRLQKKIAELEKSRAAVVDDEVAVIHSS